jgi:ketosteroid isomerase-like protein
MESEAMRKMRAGIERWNAGDFEGVIELMHPDVIWKVSPFFPDMEPVYEGHEGVRRFFEAFTEPWEQISSVLEEVIDERPGQIFIHARFEARGREGVEVDHLFPQIYRFDEKQRITEFHGFVDEGEARREAGLGDG